MNRLTKVSIGLQLLLAAGLLGAGPAWAEEAPAMTKAQHEEMAASYENEAKELEVKIGQHERAAKVYETMHAGREKQHAGQQGAAAHCRNLVKSYQGAVRDARELAKHHHMMADEAAN